MYAMVLSWLLAADESCIAYSCMASVRLYEGCIDRGTARGRRRGRRDAAARRRPKHRPAEQPQWANARQHGTAAPGMTEPAPEPAAAGGGGGEALSRTNTGALSRTASALASALDISAEDVSKVQAAMPAYSIQHLHRTLENFALEAGGDGTIDKAAFTAKLAETAGEENPALLAFSASMFEQFDTDSSGRIDSVEYHLSLAALCRGSSASKNAFIFECLDKDKSGSISFEQFFSFFKSTLAAVGRVNLAKKMGLNEDNPLYTMFAMQQIEAEKKEAEQVFAAIDKDSDGLISREEFLAALAKPATLGSPHLKAVVDLLKMFTEDDDDDAEAGEGGAEPEPEPVAAAAAAMEQPEPESEPVSVPQVDLAGFTHQIGKYLFNAEGEDALGEGGFGRVFRATNSETAEEVAIKIALEQRHTPHQLREVILQACLAHEHIVPIQDIVYDKLVKLRSGVAVSGV
jgi:Ca2+-binding EF-hand superfamily protein